MWFHRREQTRASSSWSSPPRWAQRWALRVSDWLPSRHFYCGLTDGFRVAGPLLPTPNPKRIPSLARGSKESDWVISSSGNSPWQQFKAAWKTGQQVAAIWISKASQTRKGNENQKRQGLQCLNLDAHLDTTGHREQCSQTLEVRDISLVYSYFWEILRRVPIKSELMMFIVWHSGWRTPSPALGWPQS